MRAPKLLIAVVAILGLAEGCAQRSDSPPDPGYDGHGTPYPGFVGGDVKGEKNFATLVNAYTEGRPARQPWAGAWWPYTDGGIAAKDNGDPAAKYDQAHRGATHTEDWEIVNHGPKSPDAAGWVGHCNGWSAAAALYPEPREAVTVEWRHLRGLRSQGVAERSADGSGLRLLRQPRRYLRRLLDAEVHRRRARPVLPRADQLHGPSQTDREHRPLYARSGLEPADGRLPHPVSDRRPTISAPILPRPMSTASTWTPRSGGRRTVSRRAS